MTDNTEQSSTVSGELLDQMPPAQLPTVTGHQVNPYLSMVETMITRGGDLRLKQITGVAALFANRDFSASWEVESDIDLDRLIDEEDLASVD